MPKAKSRKAEKKKKAGKKTSQLAIRVEKVERDTFVDLCDTLDTSAAREIRRFMRDFVASHSTSAEPAPTEDTPAAPEPVASAAAVVTEAPAKPKQTTATRKAAVPAAKASTAKKRATSTPPSPTEDTASVAPGRSRRTARAKPSE
jgi:hypothetical protein